MVENNGSQEHFLFTLRCFLTNLMIRFVGHDSIEDTK